MESNILQSCQGQIDVEHNIATFSITIHKKAKVKFTKYEKNKRDHKLLDQNLTKI